MEKSELTEALFSKDEEKRRLAVTDICTVVPDRIRSLSLADKFLQPIELRPGVIPAVEKDIMIPALAPKEDGSVSVQEKGDWLFFEEIQFNALVTASVPEVMQRSYAVIDRLTESAPRTIARDMDTVFLRMLSYTPFQVSWEKRVRTLLTGSISYKTLLEGVLDVEKWRLPCKAVLVSSEVHRKNQKAFLEFTNNHPDIEIVRLVDTGVELVYFLSEPRFLGYIADRVPFDFFNSDQFVGGQAMYGWMLYRLSGMVVSNTRGVAKLPVTPLHVKFGRAISKIWNKVFSYRLKLVKKS